MKICNTLDSEDARVGMGKNGLSKGQKNNRANNRRLPVPNMQITKPEDEVTVVENEHADMKIYLDKLQQMVPFNPENKTLSNLEVITSAIYYIRDLRETLGFPPTQPDTADSSLDLDFEFEPEPPHKSHQKFEEESSQSSSSTVDASKSIIVTTDLSILCEDKSTSIVSPDNSVNTHSSIPCNTSSSPSLLDQHHQHYTKRQPFCVITSPNNLSAHGQRVAQKS